MLSICIGVCCITHIRLAEHIREVNEYWNEQYYNSEEKSRSPKSQTCMCVVFCFPLRAEALAGEIKDLQGQLADYNMVKL